MNLCGLFRSVHFPTPARCESITSITRNCIRQTPPKVSLLCRSVGAGRVKWSVELSRWHRSYCEDFPRRTGQRWRPKLKGIPWSTLGGWAWGWRPNIVKNNTVMKLQRDKAGLFLKRNGVSWLRRPGPTQGCRANVRRRNSSKIFNMSNYREFWKAAAFTLKTMNSPVQHMTYTEHW
jgi:hypothetical protein